MTDELALTRYYFSSTDDTSAWELTNLSADLALSEPYAVDAHIQTDEAAPDAALLLGEDVTIEIVRGTFATRLVGIVDRVEYGDIAAGTSAVLGSARIHVVPALAALRLVTDTRVFQHKAVPDILSEVLGEALEVYGRSAVLQLDEKYAQREICMQYRESTFDFVSRLMQEEGISYHFMFDGDVESMVLTDRNQAFGVLSAAHSGAVPFIDRSNPRREGVVGFQRDRALVSTTVAVSTFDWTKPSVPLEEVQRTSDVLGRDREVYEHGRELRAVEQTGASFGPTDEKRQTKIRRELQACGDSICRGVGTVTGFMPGSTFELNGHADPALDSEYLLLRVKHRAGANGDYENEFVCSPTSVPWRAKRERRRPHIHGVQTALVVGVGGQEIHTDEHGRVRVQFAWDRQGASDDHSMCWLRVSQSWAGLGWGFQFLPRIGMEVVVSFIDGDPDRPVVSGCVYNGDNEPPYTLPDQKTKSTIRSNSSLGGDGFNEFRFEDLAGKEEVFLHAQKDFNEKVLNDHDAHVVNNQTNTVDNNQTQTIHGTQTETVHTGQKLTVAGARTVHVKGALDETISGGETRTVSGGMTETIKGGHTRTVSGGLTETVNGGETRTVNGDYDETVDGNINHTYTTDSTEVISGARNVTVTGSLKISTDASYERVALGGSTIHAAAGHTILAPGGQQAVDQKMELYGENLQWSYTSQLRAVINVHQQFVSRQALRGVDKRFTAGKVDIINSVCKKTVTKRKTVAAGAIACVVVVTLSGFMMLG